jgi:hypothetical protein
MRKKIYQWHRTLSLIIAIPVVFWAASGFMHPIMSTIRPRVATQFLQPSVIDTSKIKIGLTEALKKNNISVFHNFRLIAFENNWYYQVQPTAKDLPIYLSTQTGKKLFNGDQLYAQYIAKLFLEGQSKAIGVSSKSSADTIVTRALVSDNQKASTVEKDSIHDCCDAATNCVLLNEKGARVTGVKLVTSFDDEYKFVNRLLPVYRINFGRADGIRIYVATTSDRFGFAVDNKRAIFDNIFSFFHTWNWMDRLGNTKYYIMALLLVIAFSTTLMGVYIFFSTSTKKVAGNKLVKARRNHRWVSILISLFTMMFTFSGAFHALDKLNIDNRYDFYAQQAIPTATTLFNLDSMQSIVKQPITNISAVQINSELYWQVSTKKESINGKLTAQPRKDLMKDKQVDAPNAKYIKASDFSILKDGEKVYANYLACQFGKHPIKEVVATDLITKFEGEYGFVNKRLPVWKVSYAGNHNERYYVETSTGQLSAKINDRDLIEGYSFSMLHKHHFMDFASKEIRDFSTMFWALAQIAVVVIGLILWRRVNVNKKNKTNN